MTITIEITMNINHNRKTMIDNHNRKTMIDNHNRNYNEWQSQ